MIRPANMHPAFPAMLGAALVLASEVNADRIVLRDGRSLFATIVAEGDSTLRYLDRYDRRRKLPTLKVDSLIYDVNQVKGKVKVAFRKGQPADRSGFVRLRHSEDLDLEVEYRLDSISELDLFFKNRAHVRMLPGTSFRVVKAPKRLQDPLEIELRNGEALVAGHGPQTLIRLASSAGIAVGRGPSIFGFKTRSKDSTLMVFCLRGLVGIQEKAGSPGELAAEPLKALAYTRREGVFRPEEPDTLQVRALEKRSQDLLRYRLETVEYPPIGYLPKALTGLGFMVFFYGATLGILGYVNEI